MRFPMRGGAHHVCLPCLLRAKKPLRVEQFLFPYSIHAEPVGLRSISFSTTLGLQRNHKSISNTSKTPSVRRKSSLRIRKVSTRENSENGQLSTEHGSRKRFATVATSEKNMAVSLSEEQMQQLRVADNLRARMNSGLSKVSKEALRAGHNNVPVEQVLEAILPDNTSPEEARLITLIQKEYAGRPYVDVKDDLKKIAAHRNVRQRKVEDTKTLEILEKVGVLQSNTIPNDTGAHTIDTAPIKKTLSSATSNVRAIGRTRRSLVNAVGLGKPTYNEAEVAAFKKQRALEASSRIPSFPAKAQAKMVAAKSLAIQHVDLGEETKIPELSFDLSRVLFNPGIYHMRDPRSRVYNFDPYLEAPMPLSEFNFDALNAYVTSSEDSKLMTLARDLGKRYVGSSSSMSSALCQFHFLISQWRELNISELSKGFGEILKTFTAINRAPSAIFLRYRDGVYAVDADKEYDEPNVLMSLGKSLEKLLTLEKSDVEKWRKTHTVADKEFSDDQSEAYHYSQLGGFLLRSQLDAYDPRLPGSGVFDLKTRAVAGIRMNMREYEEGKRYEIRERFGTWESYEREHYDMMRSTFLKYSMQVRMGNMDGIFVAFHNIERLFGFQYIPLNDIDNTIHGQRDTCLGDQEFRFSVNFMNEIFDIATQEYPEQSLRFHFDTREPSAGEPSPYMNIFAEPMTNDEIDKIQKKRQENFIAYEKKLFNGENPNVVSDDLKDELEGSETVVDKMFSTLSETLSGDESKSSSSSLSPSSSSSSSSSSSTAAHKEFLDKVIESLPADAKAQAPRPILGWKLRIQNVVNSELVLRPSNLRPLDAWSLRYTIERMSDENARKLSVFSKNQRMRAMSFSQSTSGPFFRKLADLAANGAAWRQKQDDIDSQREKVVLYPDRVEPGPQST